MKVTEVMKLLGYVTQLDNRLGKIDEFRATAWRDALKHDMTLEFAQSAAAEHYANRSETLQPHHLNTAWKNHYSHLLNTQAIEYSREPADPERTQWWFDQIKAIANKTLRPEDIDHPNLTERTRAILRGDVS